MKLIAEKKSSALGKYLQDKLNAKTPDLAENVQSQRDTIFFYKNNVYHAEAEYSYFFLPILG